MTEEMREKMIDKVRKLLALATSANENEAALAAEKAQALLAQYNLDIADVKKTDVDEDEEVSIEVGGVTNRRPWRRPLALAVAQLYFCQYFYQKVGKKQEQHSFVGSKANTMVATMMFKYLTDTIENLANVSARTVPQDERIRYRIAFKGAAALRVCRRIRDRIAAAKAGEVKAEGGTNLPALLDLYQKWDARNASHIESSIGKLREKRSIVRGNHYAGERAGREAGDRIGLDTQVASGKSDVYLEQKLTPKQLAIMSALLGVSNAGMDLLFRGNHPEWTPEKLAKTYAGDRFKDITAESVAWDFCQSFCETDAMAQNFVNEAKSWVKTLKPMTVGKIKKTWPYYAAFVDALVAEKIAA